MSKENNVPIANGSCKHFAEDVSHMEMGPKDEATKSTVLEAKSSAKVKPDTDDKVAALKLKMDQLMEDYHDEMRSKAELVINHTSEPLSPEQSLSSDVCEFTPKGPATAVCKLWTSHDNIRTCPGIISASEVKELTYTKLQEELYKLQTELKLKDEAVERLSQIRDEVGTELEELTASLFEEAHNMVREANMKQANAEKLLKESNLKIDMLQAEVGALKTLVITSTPSAPNRHLHPQLEKSSSSSIFHKGHRRSPSNYELSSSPAPSSPHKQQVMQQSSHTLGQSSSTSLSSSFSRDSNPPNIITDSAIQEYDPVYYQEFASWVQEPTLSPSSNPFLGRIYREDVIPCLNFANKELQAQVLKAIEQNTLVVERVTGNSPFPKRCSLLDCPRLCKYRMKLGEKEPWCYISHICRNRLAAVCDLFCYLRYIQQGLVKSSVTEMFWEMMRRRRDIALARLGFTPL